MSQQKYPLNTDIEKIVDELTDSFSRDICRLRMGMDDGRRKTFGELAQIFNISESTARRRYKKVEQELLTVLSQKQQEINASNIDISDVLEKAKELTPYLITYLKNNEDDLRKLPWKIFEHLIAEFFASWGYEDVRCVGQNPETSADIVAMRKPDSSGVKIRYFIEVKRWKRSVGVEVINQMVGALLTERAKFGWHLGMIVTTADFKQIKKYKASQLSMLGVELRNGNDVRDWLQNYNFHKQGLWLPDPFNV